MREMGSLRLARAIIVAVRRASHPLLVACRREFVTALER
jgi:hypothetical protein